MQVSFIYHDYNVKVALSIPSGKYQEIVKEKYCFQYPVARGNSTDAVFYLPPPESEVSGISRGRSKARFPHRPQKYPLSLSPNILFSVSPPWSFYPKLHRHFLQPLPASFSPLHSSLRSYVLLIEISYCQKLLTPRL